MGVYAYGVKVKVACVKECLCVITIIAAVVVVRALVEGSGSKRGGKGNYTHIQSAARARVAGGTSSHFGRFSGGCFD